MKNASKKMNWIASMEFAIQAGMVFLSLLTAFILAMHVLLFKRFGFPEVSVHFLWCYTAFSVMGCLALCVLGCRQEQLNYQPPSEGAKS